jgi:putative ABC transport system permease protein
MNKTTLTILMRKAKKRFFAFGLNIIGLSFGICSVIFITIYSVDELSYDKHIQNHERIYRVTTEYQTNSGTDLAMAESFLGISPTLKREFPEVEEAVRVLPYKGNITIQFKSGNSNVFKAENTYKVDKEFFKVFRHSFINGNDMDFSKPNSIIVTESLSKKLFGDKSPVNKAVLVDNQMYGVVGVIDDLPKNSDFYYEALLSHDFSQYDDDWGNPAGFTYVLLHNSETANKLESKINLIAVEKALSFFVKEYDMKSNIRLSLQPISTIHFSKQLSGDTIKGNPIYLKVLITLGVLIFLIVIFNHSNFSTSIYTERIHELSVRKLMGIGKSGLLKQFAVESVTIAVLVILISIALYTILLPFTQEITGKSLTLSHLNDTTTLVILATIFLIVVISGSFYPVFYSFRNSTLTGLKGFSSLGNNRLRKFLTVGQLTFTAGLVFFTLTVHNQVSFLRNRDYGFNSDNIVMVSLPKELSSGNNLRTFTDYLQKDRPTNDFSIISELSYPGSERLGYQLGWIYNNDNRIEANFNLFEVDSIFSELLGIKFLAGGNFAPQQNEIIKQAVVNQTFVKMARFDNVRNIIGETIYAFDEKIRIVGVVSDFNYQGFQQSIKPLVMLPINSTSNDSKKVLIKLKRPEDLKNIEGIYSKLSTMDALEYTFLDERVKKMFEQETTTGRVTLTFSLLAILLATIGLYSLSNLILLQRTKEIGVRKILGISQSSLTILLSREFLFLFLISFAVAVPFAWDRSQYWLSDYAFRTDLRISTIGLSGLIIAVILILGIVTNIIRSTRINPVDLLKNE